MTAFGCFKTDSLGLAANSDGGADAGSEGHACGAGVPVHYSAAGCGSNALPICGAFNVDACTAVISYCGCDGQTTIYGACGTSPSPFLYAGACQPGSDVGPSPNPVAWHTPTVSLTADDFWIMADGQRYTSASAIVNVHSDPGWATYTTLELIWTENGREMRMFIYFYANSTSWWSDEIRTYNGQTGYGDWLYYYGTFFASPVGSAYRGNIDITNIATDQFRGEIHMHGLVLSTTLSGEKPDASPEPDGPSAAICDATESHPSATTGQEVWWWRYHWQNPSGLSSCAAWGADAKMILEVDIPATTSTSGTALPTCASDTIPTGSGPPCAMANAWRFEAACTDRQIMLELPSINTFHGWYHIESSTFPNSPRHLVTQDIHCIRDLYILPFAGSPSTGSDGGADAVPLGSDGGATDLRTVADLGGDSGADPCAACTADQVCTQIFDGICHLGSVVCKTVSDTCRAKLSASGGKSCSAFPECESEFCASLFRCVYASPCGTEAPQAAVYCYGP